MDLITLALPWRSDYFQAVRVNSLTFDLTKASFTKTNTNPYTQQYYNLKLLSIPDTFSYSHTAIKTSQFTWDASTSIFESSTCFAS